MKALIRSACACPLRRAWRVLEYGYEFPFALDRSRYSWGGAPGLWAIRFAGESVERRSVEGTDPI